MAIFVVTGAAGFVGRHLCQALRSGGHEVRGVTRHDEASLRNAGVYLWVGDLWDGGALASIFDGADYVIHCAGNAIFGNGKTYRRDNLELTRHLVDLTRSSVSIKRFVFVSTLGVADRSSSDRCHDPLTEASPCHPSSDYGRSKLDAEDMLRQSGIRYSIVRPTMVVGPDMRYGSHFSVFARWAIQSAIISRVAWPGIFSVLHVDDLAEALILAAAHPDAEGQIYYCAGEPVSIGEFFERSAPGHHRLRLGRMASALGSLPLIPFPLRALLLPALVASDARLRSLGWSPRHGAWKALDTVISREKARVDWRVDPGGLTVITGAASGLGRALVQRLAQFRAHLLLIDRDAAALESLKGIFPKLQMVAADLADPKAIAAVINSTEWKSLPVTELYACAGFGLRGKVHELSVQTQSDMMAVNVIARLQLAHAAIGGMTRAQFGRVVLISSSSAFQPLPYMAVYAASNAALLSLGEAWAAEVANDGVKLVTVCPGGMQTGFQKAAGVRVIVGEKLMSATDVADRIINGLDAAGSTQLVSLRTHVMAALSRLLPRKLSVAFWRHLMENLR